MKILHKDCLFPADVNEYTDKESSKLLLSRLIAFLIVDSFTTIKRANGARGL